MVLFGLGLPGKLHQMATDCTVHFIVSDETALCFR